ncbi:MAG: GtrA family protein [Staphylococcus epidermidis]|nr:GtrA family protein [Staphylococcus epidermidis]
MKLTRIHYEIIKFIIVGGINTFNYYITYLFLLKVLHVNYMVSHIVGFIVSFIISYYLNCYFVYKVKPMQTLLLYIFVKWLNIASEIAPFAGLIITIPVTFILSKWLLRDKV